MDDKTGALVEVTADLTSVELSTSKGSVDTTTMSKNYREFLAGISDATIKIEGIYDNASTKAGSIVFLHAHGTATSSITYQYYPNGTASGKPILSGEMFLTSASLPSGLDDAITFSAEYQNSGTVTLTTV